MDSLSRQLFSWRLLREKGRPIVAFHLDRWWDLNREHQIVDEPYFRCSLVVTADGLVGQVTRVFGSVSRVMLITARESAVRAVDAQSQSAVGVLERGSSASTLSLNRIAKDKKVDAGDTIVTAGSPGGGALPSIFPANIPIGTVTSVGQSETDIFKQVQVQPLVDLSSLQSVLVLIPKAKPPAPAAGRTNR